MTEYEEFREDFLGYEEEYALDDFSPVTIQIKV